MSEVERLRAELLAAADALERACHGDPSLALTWEIIRHARDRARAAAGAPASEGASMCGVKLITDRGGCPYVRPCPKHEGVQASHDR